MINVDKTGNNKFWSQKVTISAIKNSIFTNKFPSHHEVFSKIYKVIPPITMYLKLRLKDQLSPRRIHITYILTYITNMYVSMS